MSWTLLQADTIMVCRDTGSPGCCEKSWWKCCVKTVLAGNPVPEMQCTYGKLRLLMQGAFTGWCKHCSITPPQHHGSYRLSRNCPNPSSSCKGKHGPATWKGGQVRKRMSVGAAFPRDHESDTALAVLYHHQGKSDELVRPHCGWRGTCIAIKNSPKVDCALSLAALQPCIHHLRT